MYAVEYATPHTDRALRAHRRNERTIQAAAQVYQGKGGEMKGSLADPYPGREAMGSPANRCMDASVSFGMASRPGSREKVKTKTACKRNEVMGVNNGGGVFNGVGDVQMAKEIEWRSLQDKLKDADQNQASLKGRLKGMLAERDRLESEKEENNKLFEEWRSDRIKCDRILKGKEKRIVLAHEEYSERTRHTMNALHGQIEALKSNHAKDMERKNSELNVLRTKLTLQENFKVTNKSPRFRGTEQSSSGLENLEVYRAESVFC